MDHFELVSEYAPTGDQPGGDRRTGKGLSGRKEMPDTARCHRFRKDIYDGECHRPIK